MKLYEFIQRSDDEDGCIGAWVLLRCPRGLVEPYCLGDHFEPYVTGCNCCTEPLADWDVLASRFNPVPDEWLQADGWGVAP